MFNGSKTIAIKEKKRSKTLHFPSIWKFPTLITKDLVKGTED